MGQHSLMWSTIDKADIQDEIDTLYARGRDEDVGRVLARLMDLAERGSSAYAENIHTTLEGRNLHCVKRPDSNLGVFYTYARSPTRVLYILAFCEDVYRAFPTAAARMKNV